MRMLLLLLLYAPSLGVLAAPPRVAVVHSAWPKGKASFAKEYEAPLKDLAWPSRVFRNTDQEALLAALPETDLAIAASVANYEDTVDFGLQRDAWLAFLRRGGILLVTDASYDSVLGKWVCGFGPEFALTTGTCVAHREKTPESRLCAYRDHPLLRVPNDLRPVLSRRTNWAHLESWAPSWESLATCADGKSVMVCQRVGRGLVVVTSHFSFRSRSDHAAAKAILENLDAYRTQAASGIALTEVSFPPWTPGAGEVRLCLRNLEKEERAVAVTWTIAVGGHKTEVERHATVAPGAASSLVFLRPDLGRGRVSARLHVGAVPGVEVLDWRMEGEIPPVVAVHLARPHLSGNGQNLDAVVSLVPDAADAGGPFSLAFGIDDAPEDLVENAESGHRWIRGVQDLPDGEHLLRVRAMRGGREIGQAEATFTCRAQARVAFRADGVMLLEGKPFLPVGFYHVSQAFPPEHRMQMVRDVAAAGFNTVHTRILKLEQYGPFLDECERLGVKVITEFSVPPEQTVPRYRRHPAVLGWNPGDEPAAHGTPPEEMFARYDRFKRMDPDHLVYTVICRPSEYAAYARGTDVLAPDPYPVPNGKTSSVFPLFRSAFHEARLHGTALWAVPQCFGGYGGWKRPPTPAELRSMTYLELIAGARGFILYTYGDGNFSIREHDELWRAAGGLAHELNALAPFVLGATQTEAGEVSGHWRGVWWLGGEGRLVLVNGGDGALPFEIPGILDAKAVAGAVPDLLCRDGKATGTLAPGDRTILAVRRAFP